MLESTQGWVVATVAAALSVAGQVSAGAEETAKKPRSFIDGPERPHPRSDVRHSLREVPPPTEKVALKLLGEPSARTKALLMVNFGKDERLPRMLEFEFEQQRVQLNDAGQGGDERAGDGTFSGALVFDAESFGKEQAKRAALAQEARTTPAFQGRHVVGKRAIEFVDRRLIKRGGVFEIPRPFGLTSVDKDRELMVTATSVVEDPGRTFDPCTNTGTLMGAWTFGKLMEQMANQAATGLDASEFTRRWLRRWELPQNVNDIVVPARPSIVPTIVNPWPKLADGRLDLARAPFRLLAIVNRIDLRENLVYGGGSAGELRFVFGALDLGACAANPNAGVLQFTVIFEYGVTKANCFALHAYAQQWHALGSVVLGSGPYNAQLQAITDPVVAANADPTKANGSSLNQLRTNEIALASPWELREFRIDPLVGGHLSQVTAKQTADLPLNNSAIVRDYINSDQAAILAGTHAVPLDFPVGQPFLAGSSPTPFGVFWNGAPVVNSPDARHLFSLSTCSGCHAGETATTFTHVTPRPPGSPAGLSNFLTGLNQPTPNPVPPPASHIFADLDRRAQDLADLLDSSCLPLIRFRPLLMTH